MKANVYSTKGEKKESIELPLFFNEEYRPDMIKKAFLAETSAGYQSKGANKFAGLRSTAENWGTGAGRSRLPRVKAGPHRGGRHAKGHRYRSKGRWFPAAGTAGIIPGVRGGRQAHPPKSEKILIKRINKKELEKALKSAIAMTTSKELVTDRGHNLDGVKAIPLVVDDNIGDIKKTKEAFTALTALGLEKELGRVSLKKVRSGKGKARGRKYKKKRGPLVVLPKKKKGTGLSNIIGVDVTPANELGMKALAPGATGGRLTIWTKSSLKDLEEMLKQDGTE